MRALHVVLLLALLLPASGLARQKQADSVVPGAAAERQTRAVSQPADLQALRQDIARMKVLLQQMQSNLAFVSSSQSPLKHQFQLEIDMWQMLITEMEHRLAEPPAK